jgi:hypothetical protein
MFVRKYAGRIGRTLEKIDTGTKSGIVKILVKAGMPKKDAGMLVEVLFWLI